ncbi:mucin-5AC-like [Bombina bombina]|uniref:mucin-5AC-like n=1 Tax=Bombina bombina TaxID=8345 RepID=UPI00235AC343|nr:mucin-5AC-like [Bombina bombina]
MGNIQKYAHHWCNMLVDNNGPFAPCHTSLSPDIYMQRCATHLPASLPLNPPKPPTASLQTDTDSDTIRFSLLYEGRCCLLLAALSSVKTDSEDSSMSQTVGRRYIDELVFILSGTAIEVEDFVLYLNNNELGLQFTYKVSPKEVTYLDVVLRGFGLIKGEYISLKRNCSEHKTFLKESQVLKERFLERGYNQEVIDRAFTQVKDVDRNDLLLDLRAPRRTHNRDKLTFVTTYSSQYGQIMNNDLYDIFKKECCFVPKRNRTLGNYLSPSMVNTRNKGTGNWLSCKGHHTCGAVNYKACGHALVARQFQSQVTQKVYDISSCTNCKTNYVVYLAQCMEYKKQYVGMTTREVRVRIRKHLNDISTSTPCSALAAHFIERHKGQVESCNWLVIDKYSPLCVSGCICPKGLYLSDNKTCIPVEECPCQHNGISYQPGQIITLHCDQCVCRNRTWVCNSKPTMGICTLYGEGHYITFDSKRYTTNGECEYILVQDYCDFHDLTNGTFRIITENIPCGSTGTTCSKAIIVFLGAHKLILSDRHLELLERSNGVEIPYKVRNMGNFLVIETTYGLIIEWDKMTTIFIHLSLNFKGKVCGLCGNFDGNSNNDFTTRTQCVVEDVVEFRDSWKLSPTCPEVLEPKDPCAMNPYRIAWAQKLCSVIISDVFSACHSEVAPDKYYEDCVSDTCACDMGGDCDCYCTVVAAYAQACSEACVCIEWRSPTICPIFCDYYNKEEQCNWRYKACGGPCMKTCRNPSGSCEYELKGLEGCYPNCTEEKTLL